MTRILILYSLLAICLCACDTGNAEIKEAEESYKSEPTKENYTRLVTLYDEEIKELPQGSEKRLDYLQRALELSQEQKSNLKVISYLQQILNEYPDHENAIIWLEEMGSLYKVMNRPHVADVFYLSFTERYPQNTKTPEFKKMIRTDVPTADSLLRKLSLEMFNDSLFRLEADLAYSYVEGCQVYSLINPGDSMSAEYLHKAAETLRSLRAIDRSLKVYDKIIDQYPGHPRASQALFLKAFTYDNNLKELDSARKYYTVFLEKHPDDDFTSSAKFLLENLGKSDDELIEVLQNKQKEEVVQ